MQANFSLAQKRALVCGASSGIGRATALALASLGAEVAVLARRSEPLSKLLPKLEEAGAPKARSVVADLEEHVGLQRAIDGLLEDLGPIHILINNSGGPSSGPLLNAKNRELQQGFTRHVLAAQLLAQALVPGMREAGYGRIINIISISVREPIVNLGVSNTIRAAMAAWAKTLSKELPPGITINNVLPGFTDTERLRELLESAAALRGVSADQVLSEWLATVPEGRLASPDEVARAVAFLASPLASFVRGVSLPVDGGRLNSI